MPDEIAKKTQQSKSLCVIEKLIDDKKGSLASLFPDYYNRFPDSTSPNQVKQLQKGFQKFVQQILFSKKHSEESADVSPQIETALDTLSENISTLISEIRGEWLHWSINNSHKRILRDLKALLPLLRQKYQDPMLESDATLVDEVISDTIPDRYINFLHDMLVMMCTIYNIKVEQIREDISLWPDNSDFMNDLRDITSFLHYTLAWTTFDSVLQDNKFSINYLSRELLTGLNTFYFALEQDAMMKQRMSEKPPEKE